MKKILKPTNLFGMTPNPYSSHQGDLFLDCSFVPPFCSKTVMVSPTCTALLFLATVPITSQSLLLECGSSLCTNSSLSLIFAIGSAPQMAVTVSLFLLGPSLVRVSRSLTSITIATLNPDPQITLHFC